MLVTTFIHTGSFTLKRLCLTPSGGLCEPVGRSQRVHPGDQVFEITQPVRGDGHYFKHYEVEDQRMAERKTISSLKEFTVVGSHHLDWLESFSPDLTTLAAGPTKPARKAKVK